MSYDVTFLDADDRPCVVPDHTEGGTYALGGTTEATLNVTYNYGPIARAYVALALYRLRKHPDPMTFSEYLSRVIGLERLAEDWLPALDGERAEPWAPILETVCSAIHGGDAYLQPWRNGRTLALLRERHEDPDLEPWTAVPPLAWLYHVEATTFLNRETGPSSYWEPHPDNVARAHGILWWWATLHPDATIWVS